MQATVCCAYDCSVCYVQCKAPPERLAAPGTAGGSHSSVTLASVSEQSNRSMWPNFVLREDSSLAPLQRERACTRQFAAQ